VLFCQNARHIEVPAVFFTEGTFIVECTGYGANVKTPNNTQNFSFETTWYTEVQMGV
jgi:hypothetical protein